MAAKTTAKPKRTAQKSKVVTGRKQKQSTLRRLLGSKTGMLVAGLLIGGVGTYLLASSNAEAPLPPDSPSRGLYYSTLHAKKDINGPCGQEFEDTSRGQSATHTKACIHLDPGPEGIDVRVRAKNVEAQMAAEATYDEQNPTDPNVEPGAAAGNQAVANDAYGGTLSNVTGNPWPCVNTSVGTRVQMLYVYKARSVNRVSDLRRGFEAIARRTNAIMYNSSLSNGGAPRQVRFYHSATNCSNLIIRQVAVSGVIGDYANVVNQLRAAGYSNPTSKYLVMVDADAGCGMGAIWADTRPTADNPNNSGNTFALVWRPCWNYAEPHELMHTLGAVQPSAPYATAGYHCFDQHDVMCYNDGTHSMIQRCTGTVSYSRYDCGKDTYFNSGTPSGWLSTHWNTANSRFLTHY